MDKDFLHWIVDGLLGILLFIEKGWRNRVEKKLDEHDKELDTVRTEYVQKTDLNSLKSDLMSRFDHLEDRIDKIWNKDE